jgi:hypothetical protein
MIVHVDHESGFVFRPVPEDKLLAGLIIRVVCRPGDGERAAVGRESRGLDAAEPLNVLERQSIFHFLNVPDREPALRFRAGPKLVLRSDDKDLRSIGTEVRMAPMSFEARAEFSAGQIAEHQLPSFRPIAPRGRQPFPVPAACDLFAQISVRPPGF